MNVQKDTIIRTVILVLALVNQILAMFGYSPIPIEDEQLTEVISLSFTIAASVWAWWKNNSFSRRAIAADEYLRGGE